MPTTLPARQSPIVLRDDDFPLPLFVLIAVLGIAAQLWIGAANETYLPFVVAADAGLYLVGP